MIEKKTSAIVLAGGSGRRMGGSVKKQYLELGKKPLLCYALQAFEESVIEQVVLVTAPGEEEYCRQEIVEKYHFHKVEKITAGGQERYHSVFRGLQQLEGCEYVLIHDAARPFVTASIIEAALEGARRYQACVVGMPVKDTIKISSEDGYAQYTPDRNLVWTIQTPQAFAFSLIREAYERLLKQEEISITDDAMAVEQIMGKRVKLIKGSYYNIKITTPEDLKTAQVYLEDYKK